MQQQTLNLRGQLVSLSTPLVMGIINVTPDSFYSGSRIEGETALRARIETIINEGGHIVDLGAYSTRSGAPEVSAEEECRRLEPALRLLRDSYPDVFVSVDTFRADVAQWAAEEYGVHIINDVSGGEIDSNMFATVARLGIPYILMHMRGTPSTMAGLTEYTDLTVEVLDYFTERIDRLRQLGQHDIIIDPGFGFAKTLEQNYTLLSALPRLRAALELPMLVGLSRKSMIYRLLGTTPQDSLNGTSVLNTIALVGGCADILRVHDVRAATESIRLTQQFIASSLGDENPVYRYEREV